MSATEKRSDNMRRSRKGSLELSVNAIVVLVMAIAILGLGLAFIRGALGKAQTNVFRAIDNAQLENPATTEHPATVDRNILIKGTNPSELKLGFYNTGSDKNIKPVVGNCQGVDTSGVEVTTAMPTFSISSGQLDAPAGTAIGFQGLIKAEGVSATTGPVAGTYTCTIEFQDTDAANAVIETAQAYITVTS
jgi:hypothetical protein